MVYLIGGAPRSGKTILSRELGKKFGISWISVDSLESIVKRYIPKEQHDVHFPKDRFRELIEKSNDIMYQNNSAEEIAKAYIAQSKISWKAIEVLVECMIADQEDLIIEGHQIHPELMRKLINKYGEANLTALALTKTDIDDIVNTARQGKSENDWFINKTVNPDVHYKIAKMISEYSKYLEREAAKNNITIVTYNGNFEEQIEKAVDYFDIQAIGETNG